MIPLRQLTAGTVIVGPFVGTADGYTPSTALTIVQASVRLSKNAGAYAQKADAGSATHLELGNYQVPYGTADVDTIGRLRMDIQPTGALPWWSDYQVMGTAMYDALYGTAAYMPADVLRWNSGTVGVGYLDVAVSSRAAAASGGTGANTVTVTVTGGGNPLEGASVRLTLNGTTYLLVTNASGVAVFSLDDGTYALAVSLAGWAFTATTTVVNGDEAVSAIMTQVVIPTPSSPTGCACYFYARTVAGVAAADVVITYRLTSAGDVDNSALAGADATATSAADGLVSITLPQGALAEIDVHQGSPVRFAVPVAASYELPSIIV